MKPDSESRARLKAMFDQTMKSELERWKKFKEAQRSIDNHNTTGAKTKQQDRTSQGSRKRLSEEEYAVVKKRKKENDLLRKEWPRIIVNEQGKASSLSTEGSRRPLFMGDIQSLLLFSLLGKKSPVLPRWANLINVTKIPNVVMVHIEGIGLSDIMPNTQTPSQGSSGSETVNNSVKETTVLQEADSTMGQNRVSSSGGLPEWLKISLPGTGRTMHHSLELVAPSTHGMCPVEELLQMKTEKTVQRVIEEDLKNHEKNESKSKKEKPHQSFFRYISSLPPNTDDRLHPNDNYSRLRLLLTPGDLARFNFPLPLPGYRAHNNADFVLTSDHYQEVTSHSPMFGLDCEMCMTSIQKLELTRISVVNEEHEVIYHTLVLPYNPILNFLTKFSGITPKMLLNVTKRLEDVQKDLQSLLPPDAILVGHSLDSDLVAMKMMHPYVIDSSVTYNLTGQHNRRSALKVLSKMFLNEMIQTSEQGHDPTEDAIAALKLIQLKLKNDEAFGNVLLGWSPPSASSSGWQEVKQHSTAQVKENAENCTEKQQPKQDGNQLSDEAVGPFNRRDVNIFQKMESVSLAVVTTSLCLKNYLGVLGTLDTMPTVEVLSGNKQVSQRAGDFVATTNLTCVHMEMGKKLSQCPDEATWRRQLRKLDKRLQRIHKAAAPKSVHVYVFSGSSLKVTLNERSNGFVLVGIKDLPFRT